MERNYEDDLTRYNSNVHSILALQSFGMLVVLCWINGN